MTINHLLKLCNLICLFLLIAQTAISQEVDKQRPYIQGRLTYNGEPVAGAAVYCYANEYGNREASYRKRFSGECESDEEGVFIISAPYSEARHYYIELSVLKDDLGYFEKQAWSGNGEDLSKASTQKGLLKTVNIELKPLLTFTGKFILPERFSPSTEVKITQVGEASDDCPIVEKLPMTFRVDEPYTFHVEPRRGNPRYASYSRATIGDQYGSNGINLAQIVWDIQVKSSLEKNTQDDLTTRGLVVRNDIEFKPLSRCTIRLMDLQGKPVANNLIWLHSGVFSSGRRGCGQTFTEYARTDKHGVVEFNYVYPGEASLQFGGPLVYGLEYEKIDIAEQSQTYEIVRNKCVYSRKAYWGTLVDKNGDPIKGGIVKFLYTIDPFFTDVRYVFADENGKYFVTGLPNGPFYFASYKPGYKLAHKGGFNEGTILDPGRYDMVLESIPSEKIQEEEKRFGIAYEESVKISKEQQQ